MTAAETFALALQQHQAGRLAEAEALYRQILAAQPNHAGALHYLGVLAHQVGRHELALQWMQQAMALDRRNAVSHYNLGNLLKDRENWDEAIAAFRQAIELQPDYAEAHNNLGNVLHARGRFGEAAAHCRRALDIAPDYAEAHSTLGNALGELGQTDEAVAHHRRALALKPELPQAHYNLANALRNLGEWDEAAAAYRRAIDRQPGFALAHNNLGIALTAQKKYPEALAAFREALRLNPASPEAHHHLGLALFQQRQMEEAINSYRQALRIKPDYADAHVNLGQALREQSQLDEAVVHYRQAIKLQPDLAAAHNNLGSALSAQGDLRNAVAAFCESLRFDPENSKVQSNVILTLHVDPQADARTIQEEQQRWNRRFSDPVKPLRRPHANDRAPQRPLRIGYVSPDFRDYVVGRNLVPLFRHHDREHFEIVCYAEVPYADAMTAEFRAHASDWRDTVDVPDEAVAEMIREDRIDLLVDLAQHTGGNRLPVFARQPAPVQLSFAGYPESSGVEAIAYRMSDRWLEAAGAAEMGSRRWEIGAPLPELRTPNSDLQPAERVFLLDSFWCYDPCGVEIKVNSLPAGERGGVTFGCLNSFGKVNEPLLGRWAEILTEVAGSRLVLLCAEGSQRQRTWQYLEQHGIAPQRVEFVLPRPRRLYLELYHQLDVMLDSFPYNGHTTSLDALWMGVPVVSLRGQSSVSRGGLSILSNVGLPELVARAGDEYVRLAVALARDPNRLAQLRATLRGRMENSVLMDAAHFTRQIELAYRAMWRQWCAQTPPAR